MYLAHVVTRHAHMFVCSQVREVAFFTPELWSYIDFSADIRCIHLSHELHLQKGFVYLDLK
jgi:hypothetical protein